MMQRFRSLLLVVLAASAVLVPDGASAQQRQQPQERKFYDVYEPSQRLRTRRQSCGNDEEPVGAYCVRKCRPGYALLTATKPARCRSLTPMPLGQLPGPVRKEVGSQPLPPRQPSPAVSENTDG